MSGVICVMLGTNQGVGGGGNSVNLTNDVINAFSTATATASLRLGTDGILYGGVNGAYSPVTGQWLATPDGTLADSYEVRADLSSGVAPTGTLAAYQALIADRTWSLSRSTVGTNTCILLVQVRDILTGTVQASASFELNAEKDSFGGGDPI